MENNKELNNNLDIERDFNFEIKEIVNSNKTNEEKILLRSLTNEPLAIYEKRDDGLYHSLRGLF